MLEDLAMAYADLIKVIFGEDRAVISEDEFLAILPNMLFVKPSHNRKWHGEMYAMVIAVRFGLGGAKQMTLKECGAEFGVGAERARHVEAKALRLLRRPDNVAWYVVM